MYVLLTCICLACPVAALSLSCSCPAFWGYAKYLGYM